MARLRKGTSIYAISANIRILIAEGYTVSQAKKMAYAEAKKAVMEVRDPWARLKPVVKNAVVKTRSKLYRKKVAK